MAKCYFKKMDLEIIYEDQNLAVINKPADFLVHPTHKKEASTLVHLLLNKYPNIKNVGDDPKRPGIVHRLDRDTSGLIIVAKNNQAFYFIKAQFQKRLIEKKYLALVHGRVKDDMGQITKTIGYSPKRNSKRSALFSTHSQKAKTSYQVLKRYQNYTLLIVSPETGRTHQIRVHLSSIGYPIVGDQLYKFKRQKTPNNLKRQFLHAAYLKFQLLSGKIIELNSDLPADLKQTLEVIV